MKLDKNFQKTLLEVAAQAYPDWIYAVDTELRDLNAIPRQLDANACYLDGHGLLEAITAPDERNKIEVHAIRATAKGIDHFEDGKI